MKPCWAAPIGGQSFTQSKSLPAWHRRCTAALLLSGRVPALWLCRQLPEEPGAPLSRTSLPGWAWSAKVLGGHAAPGPRLRRRAGKGSARLPSRATEREIIVVCVGEGRRSAAAMASSRGQGAGPRRALPRRTQAECGKPLSLAAQPAPSTGTGWGRGGARSHRISMLGRRLGLHASSCSRAQEAVRTPKVLLSSAATADRTGHCMGRTARRRTTTG